MKRLLALFLSLVLMLCAAVPAYATGDGNFDGGGGGMGSGTSTNYWNPGMDGVRISVVNVDSHAVVGNTVDWSNQNPSTNMIHFGKVSKLSYNSGRALSPVVGGYTCIRPAQSLPRIISSGDYPASIAAIRSYFTDEQVIRAIAGYVGIDFDTLIAGDFKIVVEENDGVALGLVSPDFIAVKHGCYVKVLVIPEHFCTGDKARKRHVASFDIEKFVGIRGIFPEWFVDVSV